MEHATGISLIVAAALFASFYRLVIKLSGDRLTLLAGLNGISALVGLVGVWFVPPLPLASAPYLLASSMAYVASMYFLTLGYRHADFSHLTPLQGAIRVLAIAILMVLFMGEQATAYHWLAAVLVIIAFIMQMNPYDLRGAGSCWILGVAVLCGLSSAAQYVADIAGVRSVDTAWTYIVWNLFIGVPLVLYGVLSRPRAILPAMYSQLRPVLAGSALDVIGYAMILLVVHYLAVLDILPILNLHILFTAVLGVILLREPFGIRRIIASIVLLLAALVVEIT